MEVIGKFKIIDSFTTRRKGLVVVGDIIEGKVKMGSIITVTSGLGNMALIIRGVKMGYNRSMGGYFVALLLVYKDKSERRKYGALKLTEQVVEVMVEE